MIRESPTWRLACITTPLGPSMRSITFASKARWRKSISFATPLSNRYGVIVRYPFGTGLTLRFIWLVFFGGHYMALATVTIALIVAVVYALRSLGQHALPSTVAPLRPGMGFVRSGFGLAAISRADPQ